MILDNFKEITPEMINYAKDIVKNKKCDIKLCNKCMFRRANSYNDYYCSRNKYASNTDDKVVVKSAKLFLDMVGVKYE